MENRVLDVRNLSVSFSSFGETTNIVRDVSFHINEAETVGIVGESGCGKSMTAMAIMMRKIRGNQISMIFQEPMTSLNPVFTVGHQLMEVFRIHQNMNPARAKQAAIDVLRMVKIAMPEQRVDSYPYEMSGGMRQRVMIAMALACKPKLLIADEPTTALDVTIQAQILELMRELKEKVGSSIMLITHDLGVVSEVCSRVVIFYCGQVVEEAPASELFQNPLHPYTEGLLHSLPVRGSTEKQYVIPGSVPSPGKLPQGCVFHPRCKYATERCRCEPPPYIQTSEGHSVKCWRHM